MNLTPLPAPKPTDRETNDGYVLTGPERTCIIARARDFIQAVNNQWWVLLPPAVINQAACEFLPPRMAIALSWNADLTQELWNEARRCNG